MRFSEWIEKKIVETLNPELERLKREEKLLVMSMEGRKDSRGAVHGINKAGYIDAAKKLKEVRARIKEIEEGAEDKKDVRPIPAWLKGRKAV